MSRSDMQTQFLFAAKRSLSIYKYAGNSCAKLSDSRWLCDLPFMVDISKHPSELNKKLQGPNQLSNVMFVNVKSFETKLLLWTVQLQNNDTTHFPSYKSKSLLQQQELFTTVEYARKRAKISETLIKRFLDIKCKQTELNIFATSFNVSAASIPSNLQHEIIEL